MKTVTHTLGAALTLLCFAHTHQANGQSQPVNDATPVEKIEPGTAEYTARLRLRLALEAARREHIRQAGRSRHARSVLDGAGLTNVSPLRDFHSLKVTPRLIDEDPIYQRWIARAEPGIEYGIDPHPDFRPKVSYGEPAQPGHYPEVVSLVNASNNPVCTGSLLTRDTVLTAAHCFCGSGATAAVFGASTASARKSIALGAVELPASVNRVDAGATVDQCRDSTQGNDIAVVKLREKVSTRVSRLTAKVATSAELKKAIGGATIYVVGFGRTEDQDAGVKMRTSVPITNARCRPHNSVSGQLQAGCHKDQEFVSMLVDRTPARPTAGPCVGDSGGPALLPIGNKQYLVGIVSRGSRLFDGTLCGDVAIYTRMTKTKRAFVASACRAIDGMNCPKS